MKYYECSAMNTVVLFAAEGEAAQVERGFRAAEEMICHTAQRFTRFTNTSELAELNRSAGIWYPASPDLFQLVSLSLSGYQRTGGLFNPGILTALETAGFSSSTEKQRGGAESPAIWRSSQLVANAAKFTQVQLRPSTREIFLPPGLRIDLSGIAKGWMVEQAALRLAQYSRACLVDTSGDQYMIGFPGSETSWTMELENPFDSLRGLAVLSSAPGAVATTSTTRRRWRQYGMERHHIIDPRTGRPANSVWVSVTVHAAHAHDAEMLAKALLIGGPSMATGLMQGYPGAAFIAVDHHGKLWGGDGSMKVLQANRVAV
jgi:thiamine biosynthesis lipoprotein